MTFAVFMARTILRLISKRQSGAFADAAVLVRSIATGMMGVLLGIYLASLALEAEDIGVVIGAGLAGAAFSTLLVTFFSDRFGRRRTLPVLTALSVAGAVMMALSASALTLGIAAFLGMVNGMGRDRGAALVVEQSVLPATVADGQRTLAFAQYNVLQDVGHAVGSLLAAAPALLRRFTALDSTEALQGSILIYVVGSNRSPPWGACGGESRHAPGADADQRTVRHRRYRRRFSHHGAARLLLL